MVSVVLRCVVVGSIEIGMSPTSSSSRFIGVVERFRSVTNLLKFVPNGICTALDVLCSSDVLASDKE